VAAPPSSSGAVG